MSQDPVPPTKGKKMIGHVYSSRGAFETRIAWDCVRVGDPEPLPAGAQFLGFCDPCGGFRKHKLGCPLTRPRW